MALQREEGDAVRVAIYCHKIKIGGTAKRILERRGTQTSSSFAKI